MNNHALEVFKAGAPGKPGHLDAPETLSAEPWHPLLNALALECVGLGGLGGAVIHGLDEPVGHEAVGLGHPDRRSLRRRGLEAYGPVEVLAEIDDKDAGGGVGHAHGLEHLRYAHRLDHLGAHVFSGRGQQLGGPPLRFIEAGAVPAGHLQTGIVGLTVILVVMTDGTRIGGPPTFIADDLLPGAILVLQLQLEQEPGNSTIKRLATRSYKAAIANYRAQGIGTGFDFAGEVQGEVIGRLAVIRKCWVHNAVGDQFPVEIEIKESQTAHIGGGMRDLLVCMKLPAQIPRRQPAIQPSKSPRCRSTGPQFAGRLPGRIIKPDQRPLGRKHF
ncbi:MAG: hypothetical protein WCP12_12670 [bacterium]